MNSKTFAVLALLLVGTLLFAGCAQPSTGTPNTGDVMEKAPDATSVSQELTSGTGTGPNDITTDDLQELQNDLDDLDTLVEESSESNI